MTEITAKSSYHPQSTFLTLFRLAYNRIWKSRALRGWEMFWWMVFVAWFAFALNGYQHMALVVISFELARVILIVITPFVILVSIYTAHISVRVKDDPLRIVPLNPAAILVPRMLAVSLTWLQFFLPVLLLFLIIPIYWQMPYAMEPSYTYYFYFPATLSIFGCMSLWIVWGFLWGSHPFIRENKFSVPFYSLYFSPVILIYLISSLYISEPDLLMNLEVLLKPSPILPVWLINTGLIGLIAWMPLVGLAVMAWRVRTR